MKQLKYYPKLFTSLSFIWLLGSCMLFFLGRKPRTFRSEWMLRHIPDFYHHISNGCISYLLYTAVGYFWLMMGVPLKAIGLLGIVIIIANLVYELWLPILNTRDIMDAYYGIAGTGIAFVYLTIIKKFGLTEPEKGVKVN